MRAAWRVFRWFSLGFSVNQTDDYTAVALIYSPSDTPKDLCGVLLFGRKTPGVTQRLPVEMPVEILAVANSQDEDAEDLLADRVGDAVAA